jgi:hypothetical protein
MAILLACPGCKAKLKAPAIAAGHTLTCPGCKRPVKVPTAEGESTLIVKPLLPPTLPALAPKPAPTTPAPQLPTPMPPAPTPPAPAPPAPREDEEIFQDFEVVGDDPDELDEVLPVEEDVEALEEVDELDTLEEVDEPAPTQVSSGRFGWSKLLQMPLIHIRGHTGSILDSITRMDNAGYDLVSPESGRKVGVAVEVRDSTAALLRHVVGRNFVDTRVELREGRDEELLCTIRRPPYVWGSTLELLDADDEVIGIFERSPWSALTHKAVWVTTKGGKKLVQLQPRFLSGRCLFLTTDGRQVGEMMTEAAYERRITIKWCPRGGSYYVQFSQALDDRPLDRLLYLATALGLDLFATEQMSDH